MKATIEFTPASDFQKEMGEKAILSLLCTIQSFLESSHKKNKVTLEVTHKNKP